MPSLFSPQRRYDRKKTEDALAIGVALGVIVVFAFLPSAGVDLRFSYLPVAHGDLEDFYNPYWLRPLFEALAWLPFSLAYGLLSLGSLVALVVATRVFQGRLIHVLLTYPFFFLLFYGQIDALVVLGLALSWWALERDRPWWIGVGFALAALKPQISLAALILLWWWLSPSARLKSLAVPLGVVLASVLRYGWWFPGWWHHLFHGPLYRHGSITLWEVVGPWALLLWLPVFFVRLPRVKKLLLVLTVSALTMPYYQQHSLVMLQVFPIGWISWWSNVGFLFFYFRWGILRWIVLLPLVVYLRCLWRGQPWLAWPRTSGSPETRGKG